jgi:hypothetical protein
MEARALKRAANTGAGHGTGRAQDGLGRLRAGHAGKELAAERGTRMFAAARPGGLGRRPVARVVTLGQRLAERSGATATGTGARELTNGRTGG